MKIAVVSDTHGLWAGLEYPEADLLIFAGDVFGYYGNNQKINAAEQLSELKRFNTFLGTIKEKYKSILCIAGNHGFVFKRRLDEAREALTNATYLQDEATTFEDYKIYGTPWQPWFGGWAFNFPDHNANFFRARAHARKRWESIPEDVNILISHSPALGILDETAQGKNVGCQWLKERIDKLSSLTLHLFGHVHAAHGNLDRKGVLHVNASACYSHNKLEYPVTLIEMVDGIARLI
jgi:Icc-related predicted phosphoesterase